MSPQLLTYSLLLVISSYISKSNCLKAYLPDKSKSDVIEKESIGTLQNDQEYSSAKALNDHHYYRISWLGHEPNLENKKLFSDHNSSGDPDNSKNENALWITTANKEQYYCTLPVINKEDEVKKSKEESNDVSPYTLLLQLFSQEICSFKLDQYWTYELCHGKYIRQFHDDNTVNKPVTQEYYLGVYDILHVKDSESNAKDVNKNEKRPTILIEGLRLPYFEINMTDGTLCDLNNKNRFTRVLYICNKEPKNELYSIKETYTCEYEAIVFTPFLCLHSEFRVDAASDLDINCYSIGNSPVKPNGFLEAVTENKSRHTDSFYNLKTLIFDLSDEIQLSIPRTVNEEDKTNKAYSKSSIDSKKMEHFLSGGHCLRGGSGYWKYEFCYGVKVEQFHEEKGEKTVTVLLGKWDLNDHLTWLINHPSKRPIKNGINQVSYFYGNGDFCEPTGKPRQVEVKLKCRYIEGDHESFALYLTEPKPCNYVLVVESPFVCHLLNTIDENGIMSLSLF